MSLAQKIKDYRIFSIIITSITVYELHVVLQWIMDISKQNPSVEQLGLASATLTALCALVKFCLGFATSSPTNRKDNDKI